MDYLTTLGIAVGLAMDAFAVSIVAGLNMPRITLRHVFRIAFHFGLFQFIMPVLGWVAGKEMASRIGVFDHWIAFALLAFVGGKMLREAWGEHETESRADPTRGMMLITLSVATSIDALAVGISFALLHVTIWLPSVVIGIVTCVLSAIGMTCGSRFGARWGRLAEAAGGCVLLFIGGKILVSHLFA
ncbi:MAG: manganese efflux pump MntP family protein [Planctomycetota bacterium]